jgi:hypothetical protein
LVPPVEQSSSYVPGRAGGCVSAENHGLFFISQTFPSSLLGECQAVGRHWSLCLIRHHELRANRAQNLAGLCGNRVAVPGLNLPVSQIVQRIPQFQLQIAGVEFFLD